MDDKAKENAMFPTVTVKSAVESPENASKESEKIVQEPKGMGRKNNK